MINECFIGDTRDGMRQMIADGVRVQCVVTSPPYFGLRDYGTALWEGGDAGCDHREPSRFDYALNSGLGPTGVQDQSSNAGSGSLRQFRELCGKCGARRIDAQIGLESTPAEYITTMVDVFRLVRELLADDGCVFVNMGDSYLPGKQLAGMPWRLALALQADGWILRQDIIWAKSNPMPESVTDRCTKAHEYVFLLTKKPNYFYDAEAVKEKALQPLGEERRTGQGRAAAPGKLGTNGTSTSILGSNQGSAFRNKRSVWTIPSQSYSDAHFATFPEALVEPCILAGTSQRGHCPGCGKRWVRIVEKTGGTIGKSWHNHENDLGRGQSGGTSARGWEGDYKVTTLGWQPSCTCSAEPIPDIVFDPFLGSGTVARVAQRLGRNWLGCELSGDYVKLQNDRTRQQGMVLA